MGTDIEFVELASPRLRALRVDLAKGTANCLPAFWDEMARATTPLIEPDPHHPESSLVTFLWQEREPTRNVVVVEWITAVDLPDKRMTKLPGTDVWYRTVRARSDVRTVYRFSPNDSLVRRREETDWEARRSRWVLDPLNPARFLEHADVSAADRGWLGGSILTLPATPPIRWQRQPERTDAGTIEHHRFTSDILQNERDIWIYTPHNAHQDARPPGLLIHFDGERALAVLDVPGLLDTLIAAGALPPMLTVFVGNVDRGHELPCNPSFATFIADELVPWLRMNYNVSADPAEAILAGQSYGGLAAVFVAFTKSHLFGNALSQSGSFWWYPGHHPGERVQIAGNVAPFSWLTNEIATRPRGPVRYYLEVGMLEHRSADTDLPTMLTCNRHLRDVLIAKGNDVTYHEFPGGHDYLWWRENLAEGLIALHGNASRARSVATRHR